MMTEQQSKGGQQKTARSTEWVNSPHVRTGCVFIAIAYLNQLVYFPQVDSQAAAIIPTDSYKASAAFKFISFILLQSSVLFVTLMLFYKHSAFKVLGIITALVAAIAMTISCIIFTAESCNVGVCPTHLDYKVGMLSIGIAINFIGVLFLVADSCRNCVSNWNGTSPQSKQEHLENVVLRYNQTHHTQVQLVTPEMQQVPYNQQSETQQMHPPPQGFDAGVPPQGYNVGAPDIQPADEEMEEIRRGNRSPFASHTPVQTHYQY